MAKIDYSSDSCILSINGDVIGRLAKCEIERSIFDAQVYDGLRKSIDDVFLNLSVDIPNGMKLMLVQEAYEVHPMCAAMSQCDPSPLLDQLIEKLKNMNSQTVHPMCAAMTNNGGGVQRDWLKHFAEQTINQASVEGKTPTNVIADEPHEYPKYDVGGPLTDLMRINESCISIPPCQKCGCEPMMRVEERGMKNKHCWMQCTGCKNRTVVRSVEILAIRDWSQGDMWSEPPQARAGRYFPKEIADAINAGIQVNESASPAAGESAPISPEVPQAHGLTTPATPSAAVGASEPGAGDTNWNRRQQIRKAVKEYSENTTAEYPVPSDSKPKNCHNPESEDTPPHKPVMGPVVGTATVTFHNKSKTVPPEVGKRYVCGNGEITGVVARDSDATTYPFNAIVPSAGLTSWTNCGRVFTDRLHEHDLIAEYIEPEPSPSAESLDDWVTQDRVSMRECDQIRWINVDTDLPFCNQIGEWSDVVGPVRHVSHGFIDSGKYRLEIRCRRKDLPVVPADKPRMRQVTLRECKVDVPE